MSVRVRKHPAFCACLCHAVINRAECRDFRDFPHSSALAVNKSTQRIHVKILTIFLFSDLFSVNGNTLVLNLNNAALDYETAPLINVTINVTDNGQPPMSAEVW